MLGEAWDSLDRLVAASYKGEDEPSIYIYLFVFVMQLMFGLNSCFHINNFSGLRMMAESP